MERRNLLKSASLGGAALALASALAPGASAAEGAGPADGNRLFDLLVEAINTHNLDLFDRIYAAGGYTNHQALLMNNAGAAKLMGRDQAKAYFGARFKAFPDVTLATDIRVAAGDLIAANLVWIGTHKDTYLGIPATNKKVAWNSTDILRVRDGFFVEHWGAVDFFGLVKQLKS